MAMNMIRIFLPAALTVTAAIALMAGAAPSYATSSSPDTINVIDDMTLSPVSENHGVDVPVMGDATQTPVDTTIQDISPVPVEQAPAVSDAAAPSPDSLPPVEQPLIPGADSGVATGGDVLGDTGAKTQHSGQYYDAQSFVPDSTLERAGVTGPRKVDPLYEPGQRYVIVEKGAGPMSNEGQYVAATRALKLGRYAAAMEMFEKLYRSNHRDPRILMGLAVSQQGAGFVESAARTYEDLLKIEPGNADALVNLMGIMRTQYPAVTLQNLMELRDKYPTNPGIPAQIGLVNAEMKNYDDAIRYLEVAASMDPRNPSHIYNMAIITDRKGDMKSAVPLYERALQLDASLGAQAKALPREEIYDRLSTLRRKI